MVNLSVKAKFKGEKTLLCLKHVNSLGTESQQTHQRVIGELTEAAASAIAPQPFRKNISFLSPLHLLFSKHPISLNIFHIHQEEVIHLFYFFSSHIHRRELKSIAFQDRQAKI